MSRKPTTAELERRLRLQADRETSLSSSFSRRLQRRLACAPVASPRRIAPRPMTWAAAAAAALVMLGAVVALLAPPPVQPRGEAEVAAALGAVVHSSLARRPEAIARAGEQRLADEARRLLADVRQATSPLVTPWREQR